MYAAVTIWAQTRNGESLAFVVAVFCISNKLCLQIAVLKVSCASFKFN